MPPPEQHVITDTDVLREFGGYCGAVGGQVHSSGYLLEQRGGVEPSAWGGAMSRLLTLQNELAMLGASYETARTATIARLGRMEQALRRTAEDLQVVAQNYDEADARAKGRLTR